MKGTIKPHRGYWPVHLACGRPRLSWRTAAGSLGVRYHLNSIEITSPFIWYPTAPRFYEVTHISFCTLPVWGKVAFFIGKCLFFFEEFGPGAGVIMNMKPDKLDGPTQRVREGRKSGKITQIRNGT